MTVAYTYSAMRRSTLPNGMHLVTITGEAVGDGSGGYIGGTNFDLATVIQPGEEVWYLDGSFQDDDTAVAAQAGAYIVDTQDWTALHTGGAGITRSLCTSYLYSTGSRKSGYNQVLAPPNPVYLGQRRTATAYITAQSVTNTNAKTYTFHLRFIVKPNKS